MQIWGKHELGVRTRKYKLGARAGKYKLGARARARGQAKGRDLGNTNTLLVTIFMRNPDLRATGTDFSW